MKFSLAVSLTALVAAVVAQQVPPCVDVCFRKQQACPDEWDLKCLCEDEQFHIEMTQCMRGDYGESGECSEEDQFIARILLDAACGA
ncbi:hypothetical protein BDV38DRAFT_288501 [Aspergillus pseudotamarii]|uniref:CFEM domain-containing protein n=1 Tax=Aspergillus pseudotamarii TaxID=132259 RepID=A0A5N6SA79_ASPPS|nr:uncharacterized protein BDV38DRAFT_288501 [Aspergillus pseudotamarii]KAE8131628.1 hypothetical protein BDV38DRAFT_288501 [Aspergillus pseudotamarii]